MDERQPETGYLHPQYADALSCYGRPQFLPLSRSAIVIRSIPGSRHVDATGCYPLFACARWDRLPADLDEIGATLVCLFVVADPFGEYDDALLRRCFKDVLLPYKQHHVIDMRKRNVFSKQHARNVRKAMSRIEVEVCENTGQVAEDWVALYSHLIRKHQIRGFAAFPRESLISQLRVPGLVIFRARHQGASVGMVLWYVHQDVAFYHLGAYSKSGYDVCASFGLFASSIEYFANRVRWLNLGGGAGVYPNPEDGLSRFKQGWTNETRTAYFCGRIFDAETYHSLALRNGQCGTDYFPIYRKGEWR
jgi:hypothetical protein